MRKLTGLLVFAVALGGAILLTSYYKQKYAPPPPPPAPTAAAPAPPATGAGMTKAPPSSVYTDAGGKAPVTFKTQAVALDPAGRKARVSLLLEHEPAGPGPASVWVWAYFFTPDAPGRYCAGDPVELRRPFGKESGASVKVEMTVKDCPAPRDASSRYYARVNVSAESAFAARLAEQRISYDTTQASPVTVEGAKPAGR